MNGQALGYLYGCGLALFAITVIPPMLIAFNAGESAALAGFLVTGLTAGFIGGALMIALRNTDLEIKRREQITLVLLFWLGFTFLAAIPFEASGAIPSRLEAIFEAASALTTTGATMVDRVAGLPRSILFWRSELQWIGGFLTLFTITFLLLRIWGAERAEQEIFKSPLEISDSTHNILTTMRLVLPIYAGLTIFFIFLMLIAGVPTFDAVNLVLTTISTGGMMPRDGHISSYGNIPMVYILTLTMFFGAVSILWSHFLIKQQWSGLKKFKEPLWVAGVITALAIASLWLKYRYDEGRDMLGVGWEIGSAFFDAASLVSTTGITTSTTSLAFLAPTLILVIMFIGGGIISTAGGVKFTRIMLMFRQSRGELRSLIHPHEVRPLHLSHEEKDEKYLSNVWVIFGLAILLIILLSVFLAYHGLGLKAALFTAISALSNCGPCLTSLETQHTITSIPYNQLASPAKIAIIIAMIIGRLEFLVAISIFHLSFWRH